MKNKGFVLIETMIIICVLCVGLLSIYKSYSSVVAKINNDDVNKTFENNYKAKYIAEKVLWNDEDIENYDYIILTKNGEFLKRKKCVSNSCENEDLLEISNLSANFLDTLNIEKIIYTRNNIIDIIRDNILKFDGSTITYLNSIKNNELLDDGILMTVIIKTKEKTFGYYQLKNNFIGTELQTPIDGNFNLVTYVNDVETSEFPLTSNYNVEVICVNVEKSESLVGAKVEWDGSKWIFSTPLITQTKVLCKVNFTQI